MDMHKLFYNRYTICETSNDEMIKKRDELSRQAKWRQFRPSCTEKLQESLFEIAKRQNRVQVYPIQERCCDRGNRGGEIVTQTPCRCQVYRPSEITSARSRPKAVDCGSNITCRECLLYWGMHARTSLYIYYKSTCYEYNSTVEYNQH